MIYVGMCAYNAEPLVTAAVKSVAPYVDKIVLVDGSTKGPSTDNTVALARAAAANIEVIQGAFKKEGGGWDEKAQRQAYIDAMPKDASDWCLVVDADEVYDDENMRRLIDHIERAPSRTRLISHRWLHLWRRLDRVRVDSHWGKTRDYGAFRLTEQVRQITYCNVGEHNMDNWGVLRHPFRIKLDDVVGYHYGHARPWSEMVKKWTLYYEAGYYQMKERFGSLEGYIEYKRRQEEHNTEATLVPFEGTHPEAVRPFLETYFKGETND